MRRTPFALAKDLYKILGVSKNANDDEIKKAYKKKAAQLHPDVSKSPNASKEFSELNDAYETLKDAKKREFYRDTGAKPQSDADMRGYEDLKRERARQQSHARQQAEEMQRRQQTYYDMDPEMVHSMGGMGGMGGMGSRFSGGNFRRFEHNPWGEDPHEQAFYARASGHPGFDDIEFEGQRYGFDGHPGYGHPGYQGHSAPRSRKPPRKQKPVEKKRGEDVISDVNLTFDESIEGCSKVVTFKVNRACWGCEGSGSSREASSTCQQCGGYGRYMLQMTPADVVQVVCEVCNGQGELTTSCKKCKGSGNLHTETSVSVGLPPGLDTGSHVRLVGEGNSGSNGGDTGDLVLRIKSTNTGSRFVRGSDGALHTTIPIPLSTAITGGKVTIKGVRGEDVAVQVSPGTHHLSSQVLEAKGAFHLPKREVVIRGKKPETPQDGSFGKVVGHFVVSYPSMKDLSAEQIAMLGNLPDTGAAAPLARKLERDAMSLLRAKHVSQGFKADDKTSAKKSSEQNSGSSNNSKGSNIKGKGGNTGGTHKRHYRVHRR